MLKAFALILLLVSLAAGVQSQPQTVLMTADAWKEDARLEQKATLVYPGGPMNEMLARLTKEYGVELSAASNTKEDLIVLMVTEQPLSVVLPKIAKHFNFEWERSGEKPEYRYRLYQTAKAAQDEEEARKKSDSQGETVSAMRKRIEKMIANLSLPRAAAYKEVEKILAEAEKENVYEKRRKILSKINGYAGVFSGSDRLVLSVIKGFTPQDWQQALTMEGVIFSTHPWGTEQPILPSLAALAQQEADFQVAIRRQEYERSRALLPDYQPPMQPISPDESTEAESESSEITMVIPGEDQGPPEPVKLGGTKVQFKTHPGYALGAEMMFFDEQGEALKWLRFYASLNENALSFAPPFSQWFTDRPDLEKRLNKALEENELEDFSEEEPSQEIESAVKASAKEPLLATKITLPEDALKLFSWALKPPENNEDFEERERLEMTMLGWLDERLKEIEKRDPLEWSYSPLLKNIHEQAKLNLLSDGFDAYINSGNNFEKSDADPFMKAQTLADFLNAFSGTFQIESTLDQGWLTLRKRDYPQARSKQVPRPLLRKWTKRLNNASKPLLDDFAELAADLKDREVNGHLGVFGSVVGLVRLLDDTFFYPYTQELLRFYATLTAEQKRIALGEKGLSLEEMNASQQTQYKKLLRSGPYEYAALTHLSDPLEKVEPSKLALKLKREEYTGYQAQFTFDGQPTPYRIEASEDEYKAILKVKERQKGPHAASYDFKSSKGTVIKETLEMAADTPSARQFSNVSFRPETPPEGKDDRAAEPANNSK